MELLRRPTSIDFMGQRRLAVIVSAVLLAAPYARSEVVELEFRDGVLVSGPYVELTLQVMRAFGADADWAPSGGVRVKARRPYVGRPYDIEADASAASESAIEGCGRGFTDRSFSTSASTRRAIATGAPSVNESRATSSY